MSMPWLEAIAAALGLVNAYLLVRRHVWNYAFGIAAVTLYGWIFFQSKLYSDTLLQVFYVVVQVYGWSNWASSKMAFGEVVVLRLTWSGRVAWILGIAAATAGWGWVMHRYTDAAAPWLDAGVAMTAVVAQILLTQRKIETWYLWLAVNAMSIVLYASRELYVTTALYCVLLVFAAWSLVAWRSAHDARLAHGAFPVLPADAAASTAR
jgi:nicotinamide mononucleotide transporter